MSSEQNLVRTIRSTIRHNASRPAMLDGDKSLTWQEFGTRVAKLAGALKANGVGPGAHYAIASRNGFRTEELKWAGFWLGAIPILVNWRLAAAEIAPILADAECVHVFAESTFAGLFEDPALSGWRGGTTIFGNANGADAAVYDDLIASSQAAAATDPAPDSDAIVIYTGGTTGRSKGVRLSHGNILANALAFGSPRPPWSASRTKCWAKPWSPRWSPSRPHGRAPTSSRATAGR
jgi:long-chain acyl-CoA synthetase